MCIYQKFFLISYIWKSWWNPKTYDKIDSKSLQNSFIKYYMLHEERGKHIALNIYIGRKEGLKIKQLNNQLKLEK